MLYPLSYGRAVREWFHAHQDHLIRRQPWLPVGQVRSCSTDRACDPTRLLGVGTRNGDMVTARESSWELGSRELGAGSPAPARHPTPPSLSLPLTGGAGETGRLTPFVSAVGLVALSPANPKKSRPDGRLFL